MSACHYLNERVDMTMVSKPVLFCFWLVTSIWISTCDDIKCKKRQRLEKMLAKAEETVLQQQQQNGPPIMNRYTEFIEMNDEIGNQHNEILQKSCHSKKLSALPRHLIENCDEIVEDNFASQTSILSSLHNGRLGNQMSSFATLYAFNQLSKNTFRIGLTNDQYLSLSPIFPYFEKNAKKYLIEALHCDSACSKLLWTQFPLPKMSIEEDQWHILIEQSVTKLGRGFALNLGSYINFPVLYQNFMEYLRNHVFQIRSEYHQKAVGIVNAIKQENANLTLIGVHARYTDYRGHLKQRGGKYLKPKFFIKAMNHFREKYSNQTRFLVVSDEVPKAKKVIIDSQPHHRDIIFVGTIDDAIDGKVSKEESVGVDLALLSLCQHVIMTHGTFGLWSTFLSSTENEHIVADEYIKDDSNDSMEELTALKNAHFKNYLFMNDH